MRDSRYLSLLFLLLPLAAAAQSTLTGVVRDAYTQEPLLGATVLLRGSTIGTVTDLDGAFALPYAEALPAVLVASYIGYVTQEITVTTWSGDIELQPTTADLGEVVVTARRGSENVQVVPIPVAVLGAAELENSVSFNVNRVKELVPSVQLYSSNPRNTTLNIRGLGSTFGLTNDGIDPGVGFYVDGVYYSRAAATSLDFIDVQQIEVLRGPQGTLFGKNTTAGAFNVVSRKPTFDPSVTIEQSFGNYGFVQTKGSVSGPLIANRLAARISFTGTNREGTLFNVRTQERVNTLNNQGIRGQLLFLATERNTLTFSADYTRQRPNGYAQVYAGTVPTLRAPFRQFDAIIADLNYTLPSRNPFDRLIDHDTPWRADQDMGGVSLTSEWKLRDYTLTSISAARFWDWSSSNDRDFTGLASVSRSQAPSLHRQYSQEVRLSGPLGASATGVFGAFAFYQTLRPDGAHVLEAGPDQWRFVQNRQDSLWQTPGLLDGLTQYTYPEYENFSGAVFGQVTWNVSERLSLVPGIRLNYDDKSVNFLQTVSGGLDTSDPALLALKKQVFSPQQFATDVDDFNVSGQLAANWSWTDHFRTYGIYALTFKPVGLNLGGIPEADNVPLLDLAVVRPERVNHFEWGIKSEPGSNATLNVSAFYTTIHDYQTNVQSEQLGVTRGYLANADRVSVKGVELESSLSNKRHFSGHGSVSYTDGRYVSFPDAPVPLEGTGGEPAVDISGERLPGISRWTGTLGGESFTTGRLLGREGQWFVGADGYARTGFSSSPSPSRYLNVDGYAILNARLGFRMPVGLSVFAWARNLTDTRYFEQLLPAGGNAGHYAAVLGDPATYGLTIRYTSM